MKLLTREQSATYLKDCGLRASRMTLARLAMSGEGPRYTLIGRTAYYQQEWLDEWLENLLKPNAHSLMHLRGSDKI